MKELYEAIDIDVVLINQSDVITTSGSFDDEDSDHDNGYIDTDELE